MPVALKGGWKRENIEHEYWLVRHLPGGGSLHKKRATDDEISAYDAHNNYLGWTNDEAQAMYAANHGYQLSIPDDANDLDLWLLWSAVAGSGNAVYVAENGDQVIGLKDSMYMVARKCESGYECGLLTDVQLHDEYGDDTEHGFVICLRRATSDEILLLA